MPSPPRSLSEQLHLRALSQGGVFSRSEAIDCGHADRDLPMWVRAGLVVKAARGAYYLSPEREPGWERQSPVEQQVEHERLRIRAVLHVLPAAFVASHGSALCLHDLPRLQAPDPVATVHVMSVGPQVTAPRRPGVKVHAPVVWWTQ